MQTKIPFRILTKAETQTYCIPVEEAAAKMGKHPQWIRHLMRTGALTAVRKGQRMYTSQLAIEKYKPNLPGKPVAEVKRDISMHLRLSVDERGAVDAMGGQEGLRRIIRNFMNSDEYVGACEASVRAEMLGELPVLAPKDNPMSGDYAGPGVFKLDATGRVTMDTRSQAVKDADPLYGKRIYAPGHDDNGPIPGWENPDSTLNYVRTTFGDD